MVWSARFRSGRSKLGVGPIFCGAVFVPPPPPLHDRAYVNAFNDLYCSQFSTHAHPRMCKRTVRRLPNNEDLPLKDLSLKLVMLMALTTASRHSELHKLKMSSMCDKGDIVEFHIGDLTKTRKVGEGPLVVQLVPYDPEPKLDVVSCLRQYLAVTKSLRKPATEGEQLLLSFRQPHGPLAASSVARWLKMGRTEAGIDVTKYQAKHHGNQVK